MRTLLVLLAWCVPLHRHGVCPVAAVVGITARRTPRTHGGARVRRRRRPRRTPAEDATDAGDHETAPWHAHARRPCAIDQERFADARALTTAARDTARTHGLRQRELEATLLLCRIRTVEGDATGAAVDVAARWTPWPSSTTPREQLLWAYSQALVGDAGMTEHDAMLARANAHLRPDDRFPIACSLWQSNGDQHFNAARYGEAHESLTTSLCLLRGPRRRAATPGGCS